MSIYSRKRSKRQSPSHLGHLKLSIYEDSGALAVTVYEARGLKRRDRAQYDTYVKIYMLPDPGKHTKEKTRRVREKDPVFDAKFNFLLNDKEDCNKCLFISVWNRERAGRIDMIGCMTFKVSDLINSNGINGWYQLLGEEKGKKENVPVPSALSKMGSVSSLASTMSAPPTISCRNFAVTLVRSPKGYGFKVTVGTPVYINEVTEGLPAHQLDIHVGDMIIEVEGTDVIRANGELVANMIKKQRDTLQMILKRNDANISPPTSLQPYTAQSLTDLSQNDTSSVRNQYNLPSFSSSQTSRLDSSFEGRFHQPGILTQPTDSSDYPMDDLSWMNTAQLRDRLVKSKERLPEVPEEYSHTVTSSNRTNNDTNGYSRSNSEYSQRLGNVPGDFVSPPPPSLFSGHLSFSQPGGLDTASKQYQSKVETIRKHSLGSPMDENKGLYDLAVTSMRRRGSVGGAVVPPQQGRSFQRIKTSSGSLGSTEDSAYSTANSSRSLNQLQHSDSSLSPSIFDLQNRERSPPMDTAIQKISPTSPVFNEYNGRTSSSMEEITYIDWENLNKLEQKRQKYINSLIKCEKEFCDELKRGVDAFLSPLSGVISDNSHRTIFMSLDRMYELSKYFYTQFSQHTIACSRATNISYYVDEFACFYHSKLHLLVKSFEAYLRNSESARKEIAVCFTNDDFKRIVREPSILYSFVEAGTEYLPKMCRLLIGICYVTPLDHSDHQYLTNIINTIIDLLPPSAKDLRKNWKTEKDIMENLKSAITFNSTNGVESFDIIKSGRVLLHEGEAHLVEKRKKRKVWLLLFSDILLITKRSRHVLTVIELPFYLNNIIVQDVNSEEDEFQISTDDGVTSRQFKVVSRHERGIWFQKLKERATGSLKRHSTKQHDVIITKKQGILRSELKQELKTPYRPVRKDIESEIHFENENSLICTNLEETFAAQDLEGDSLTQVAPDFVQYREFVPPHSSVVFPMSQPILPSKFSTLPNKRPESKQSNTARKVSGMFKRKSVDLSSLSQSSFGFPSPLFSKKLKNDSSGAKSRTHSREETSILSRINRDRLERWSESLHELLIDSVGCRLFEEFLVKECSQENLAFWKACKKYSDPWSTPDDKLQSVAESIFSEFISHHAPNLVNIDHTVRTSIMTSMTAGATRTSFDQAMVSIFTLMERDSYSRFAKQPEFREALALSKVF